MKFGDKSYWAYNMPLQLWPRYMDDNEEEVDFSKIGEFRICNYMPRKETCCEIQLDEFEITTREDLTQFCEVTAQHLENLAKQFRDFADGRRRLIYYHDDGMDKKHLFPSKETDNG